MNEETKDRGSDAWYFRITVAIVVGMIGTFGFLLWYGNHRQLAPCDEAIKKTLRAPATYRRVSDGGVPGFRSIDYDAENAFGVPLRGHGFCSTSEDGTTKWLELPRPLAD